MAACWSTPTIVLLLGIVLRVFTHELVRHRAGSAFSQESLRYVRLTDIGFRVPPALEPVREQVLSIVEQLEEFQLSAAASLASTRGRAVPRQEGGHLRAAPPRPDRPLHRHRLDGQRAHAKPRDRDAHRRGRRGGAAAGVRSDRARSCGPRRPTCFRTSPARTTAPGCLSTARCEAGRGRCLSFVPARDILSEMAATASSVIIAPITTAEELFAMPDDGMRHELIRGELTTMTHPGAEHGRVAATVGFFLGAHTRKTGSGVTMGEAGFVLARDPDTVRAPDTAFVAKDRAEAIGRTPKYWPEAPALAVEVISPTTPIARFTTRRSNGLRPAAQSCSCSTRPSGRRPCTAGRARRTCTASRTRWT